MTVSYITYKYEKDMFFKKHKYDFETNTSPMDEYGKYHKTYVFKDGAVWYETMFPEYVKQEIETEIKFIKIKTEIEIKMFVIEFWNTDNSKSKKYYEKF